MKTSMEHSSARVLEFDLLLGVLRGYAQSPLGQQRITQLKPSTDRSWIELQQDLTAEAGGFLRSGSRFDFSGLFDPGMLLDKSRIEGAILEAGELRDLLLLVERADEWRAVIENPPTNFRRQEAEEHQ